VVKEQGVTVIVSPRLPVDSNPDAFPLEDGLYGARFGYPNLMPNQLHTELALASASNLTIRVLDETLEPETIQALLQDLKGAEWLYVVLLDGRMLLASIALAKSPFATTHTMLSLGEPVIAAGHLRFDQNCQVVAYNHMSGHYRPEKRQTDEVVQAVLTLSGVLMTG